MRLLRRIKNLGPVRWLFQNVFVTGDNVRLCVQEPIIAQLLPAQADVALDAGCGSGEYTQRLIMPRADFVIALDADAESLRRLDSRLTDHRRHGTRLVRASVDHLPLPADCFDLVVCTEVLEHCRDDTLVIAEFARVLRPGGVLVISVPMPPPPVADTAHVTEGYTVEQLANRLEAQGFEPTGAETCIFAMTRQAISLAWWFRRYFKLPPPLMALCHLERWLGRRAPGTNRPYDLVMRATLRDA